MCKTNMLIAELIVKGVDLPYIDILYKQIWQEVNSKYILNTVYIFAVHLVHPTVTAKINYVIFILHNTTLFRQGEL